MTTLLWLLISSATAADLPTAHQALAPRHDPGCAAFDASDVPVLVELAQTQTSPPWVASRAGSCTLNWVDTSPVALDAASRWAADPELLGLALLVADRLPALEDSTALDLATKLHTAAEANPRLSRLVQPRLARSDRPEIRALTE